MAEKTTVKIFIASSAELKDEREKCVLLINQLNESHKHLHLKPVEWEYSMVHANYPGHKNIQALLLLCCWRVIWPFLSSILK